jgi:hypothetical protein
VDQRVSSSSRERGAALEEALGPRVARIYQSAFRRPRPVARLLAALGRARLDGALAVGADPCESLALAHRAARLTSDRSRRRLAKEIDGVISAAARPTTGLSSAAPVDAREVAAAAPRLIEIRELLRSRLPVYAKGVAMLRRLLRDGGGPLYSPAWQGALTDMLEVVIAALEGRELTSPH